VFGHRQIQEHDFRLELAGEFDRFGAIARLPDDLQIGFGLEQPSEAISKNWMVISNDKVYGTFSIHGQLPYVAES
jgi:uncharacterized protein YegJ (DUF2314 family)